MIIAQVLRVPVESLFPEQHLEERLKVSSGEIEVSKEEIASLLDPETPSIEVSMEREQTHQVLEYLINKLKPRYREVIRRLYYYGETRQQVAEQMQISLSRVQQIESKVLFKLKHPARSMRLRRCGGYDFLDKRDSDSQWNPVRGEDEVYRES